MDASTLLASRVEAWLAGKAKIGVDAVPLAAPLIDSVKLAAAGLNETLAEIVPPLSNWTDTGCSIALSAAAVKRKVKGGAITCTRLVSVPAFPPAKVTPAALEVQSTAGAAVYWSSIGTPDRTSR